MRCIMWVVFSTGPIKPQKGKIRLRTNRPPSLLINTEFNNHQQPHAVSGIHLDTGGLKAVLVFNVKHSTFVTEPILNY